MRIECFVGDEVVEVEGDYTPGEKGHNVFSGPDPDPDVPESFSLTAVYYKGQDVTNLLRGLCDAKGDDVLEALDEAAGIMAHEEAVAEEEYRAEERADSMREMREFDKE